MDKEDYVSITRNEKKIVMDKERLKELDWVLDGALRGIKEGYIVPKKTTMDEVKKATDEYQKIMADIIDGKVDVFDSIPQTKAGLWHKSRTWLIKSSGIKLVESGDFFAQDILQLRLIPIPSSKKYMSDVHGDGKTLYMEIGWFSRPNEDEEAIIADDGTVKKLQTKANNVYLKQDDLLEGHDYEDGNGVQYKYLGRGKWNYDRTSQRYLYCKLTPKAKKVIAECEDIDLALDKLPIKELWNPLKFVKEVTEPETE